MCDSYNCTGLFKCVKLGVQACIHVTSVCDGTEDCMSGEDEYFCDIPPTCPIQCNCVLFAIKCTNSGIFKIYHLFNSNFQSFKLKNISLHPYISTENIELASTVSVFTWTRSNLEELYFLYIFSVTLKFLELSYNRIKLLPDSYFAGIPNIIAIHLNNNDLRALKPFTFKSLTHLVKLDLSQNSIGHMSDKVYLSLTLFCLKYKL